MNLALDDNLRREIAQSAARIPNSTITSARLDPDLDTWAVKLNETCRPSEILIGAKAHSSLKREIWPALASHEAGHSSATFYTPDHADISKDFCQSIGNIIEDIRIDNGIQALFPGLINGYKLKTQHWITKHLPKIDEYSNGKLIIKDFQCLIAGIILFKFFGITATHKNVEFVNHTEEIKLRNNTCKKLNLRVMWDDLTDTVQKAADINPRFTSSLSERKNNNKIAVSYINQWLDKYAWVFRNLPVKKLNAPSDPLQAKRIGHEPGDQEGDNHELQPCDELPTPKSLEEKTNDLTTKLTEIISKDDSILTSWVNPELIRSMLPEVIRHFPVKPPKPASIQGSHKSMVKTPSLDGNLSYSQVENYIVSNRPANYPVFYTESKKFRKLPPLHPNPIKGNSFPLKRLALYLDLSGSMTGAVGNMLSFTQCLAQFAKEHKLLIKVVVGNTGIADIKPGNQQDINNLLQMQKGNSSNNPTWQPKHMEQVLNWVGKPESGKAIFVTDMEIQESEISFIKKAIAVKKGIQFKGDNFNIAAIADLFWGRNSALPKSSRISNHATAQITE